MAQRLRVGVGEALGGHVVAAVRVALDVGMTDAGHPQRFELVVLPHPGERDPIVDLADLVEGSAGVFPQQENAVDVLQRHYRAAPGYAFDGVLGPVLHELLGRDVEGKAHGAASRAAVEISRT